MYFLQTEMSRRPTVSNDAEIRLADRHMASVPLVFIIAEGWGGMEKGYGRES
jgi:hypothetical protein